MIFDLFGRRRLEKQQEKLEKQQEGLAALTLQVERSLVEFKLEIRNLRSSLESQGAITEKDLDRMANSVEKLEGKFSTFTDAIQREHRKFGESDVRHTEQIISLFKIAERANLISDDEKKQLNLYVQTNTGNGQQVGENHGEIDG